MIGRVAGLLTAAGTLRQSLAFGRRRSTDATPVSVPRPIAGFLSGNHVVGLAVVDEGIPWSASCFYAFEAATMTLIVMTSTKTRHGGAMLTHPIVSGTIAGQPSAIASIRGLQFQARATLLVGQERQEASHRFIQRHPAAAIMPSDVWAIALDLVKYTENKLAFARKLYWSRPQGGQSIQQGSIP